MRQRMNNQPYVVPQVYYYEQPSTQSFAPLMNKDGTIIENPNDQRFGGLLLPAVGGFLVGTLVPRPWGNNTNGPMYGYPVNNQPMMYSPYPINAPQMNTIPSYTNSPIPQ